MFRGVVAGVPSADSKQLRSPRRPPLHQAASVNIRFRQRESVSQKLEAGLRAVSDNHLDDVETKKNVGIIQEPQPGEPAAGYAVLFVAIDRIERSAEIFARARFYLDENKCVVVAADDVDLAAAAATKIPVENFVTISSQKAARQFLAARAELEMLGIRTRKPAAPPVRKIGDGSDKARVHAI